LHACTPRPRRDILGHPCFAWLIVIFNFWIKPLLVPYSELWTSPRHTPVWPLAWALNAWDRVQTHTTFVLEACDEIS